MKLHFGGQTYSRISRQIPTIASENAVCYRGQQYNLHMPVVICQSRLSESLISVAVYKYRGVKPRLDRKLEFQEIHFSPFPLDARKVYPPHLVPLSPLT